MWMCIWFQQGGRNSVTNVKLEWNHSLPSISYCQWSFSSTISHLLQSVTLLACSLYVSPRMPAVVLYYYTLKYCAVRVKMFYCFLFFVFKFYFIFKLYITVLVLPVLLFFMYYLYEKYYKPIIVQYYIAKCVTWVPTLSLLHSQICSWNRTCSYVGDLLCLSVCIYFWFFFPIYWV